MKLIKSLATLAIVGLFAVPAQAGRIKIVEGNLDALKGQTDVNLLFDYSAVAVGKYKNEADYIADKVEAYNKKEPGKGDAWAKAWVNDRDTRFQPAFIEKFEDESKLNVSAKAKYAFIIKTKFIEPGYNVYVSRKNAEIDCEVWLVDAADPTKALCKMAVENNPGRTYGGYDYDTGVRIAESYEYAGKYFGKFLRDELK
jgi:hypothetical protein